MSEDTKNHPSPALLERFMRNETEGEERRRVVRHLLSGCARCVAVTRRFWSLGEAGQEILPGELHPASYGGVFERLVDGGFQREREALEDHREAPARFAELLDLPRSAGLARIEADRRFQTPALCELLIGESQRTGDPLWAEWAVAAAERLDARRYGAMLARSLRGRAWAWLGNARRLAGDLRRAEEALARAEEPLLEGADPMEGAELEELKARLLAAQGRSREAQLRLDRTLSLYRTLGEKHLEARVLIQKGTIRGWSPEPEAAAEAVHLLEEGLALLEEDGDPPLVAFGLHRLALLLAEAPEISGVGRVEALGIIRRARALYEEQGDGPNLIRLRHLEGKIADACGDEEAAEAAFLEARQGYVAEKLGGEAAETLFDLAILYTRQGRSAEIHGLTENLLPILQARDIRQGVAVALLYFRRLVETGYATLDVLCEVARYVASLPRDRRPALR